MSIITDAYDDLVLELSQDEDDDVLTTDDGLLVHGERFAFLDGEALAIKLSAERGDDLIARGIAKHHPDGDGWVSVEDLELWSELAAEAHTFVGEPAVGGQS